MKTKSTNRSVQNKSIIRIMLMTALILLVPLIAMRFSNDVKWDATDFATIGALLIGIGLLYELVVKKVSNTKHRVVIGIVFVIVLVLIWAELAVGIFGTPFAGN